MYAFVHVCVQTEHGRTDADSEVSTCMQNGYAESEVRIVCVQLREYW